MNTPKWSTAAAVMANPGVAREEIHALRSQVRELLIAAKRAYTILAPSSHQWPGRHTAEGQGTLCALRDAIAAAEGRESQDVQDDAESAATAKGEA